MGLSSSQARLLTITARLTSNEYESQQISNAKMRLATQSQEASEEYISALNKQLLSVVSFDGNGNSTTTALTAAALYEYNDTKNQYILSNSSGKVLLSNKDAKNYESSQNLEDFLAKYGLNKIFKTQALENAYAGVRAKMGYDANGNYNQNNDYKKAYENLAKSYRTEANKKNWINEKNTKQVAYLDAMNNYKLLFSQQEQGNSVTNDEINTAQTAMENARNQYLPVVSFESWIEDQLKNRTEYKNYQEYKSALALYNDELDNEGITPARAYQWDDQTKAQWYTNLWYKINGSSTGNMHTNNYAEMDTKMMTSTAWVSDSISKGVINIEAVTYSGSEMALKYDSDPFLFTLNGINWETKIYSSCPDIIASDNEKVVAKAEAEYTHKTAEINAKDEKYQRKLSLLDSEHHAIQTEYDSVKSAIDKNISRSYKAFQG